MRNSKQFLHSARGLRSALYLVCALGTAATTQATILWHDIQFSGFVSQGFTVNSGVNDYLGNSSKGSFDFREYAANASWATGKLRLGAQLFGQKLGAYGDDKIRLDWATADYQATQWFGLRAGRVKMPRGLYNEALDLDVVRPFVLLPQSVYDPRLRDFHASFDGGMAYGNITLKRFGSLDYKAFFGEVPIEPDSGANDYFNSDRTMVNISIAMKRAFGGTLFWNTPLEGLRVGYSYSRFDELKSVRNFLTTGAPGGIHTKVADTYPRNMASAEYANGPWTIASEYGWETGRYIVDLTSIGRGIIPVVSDNNQFYISVARRLNDKFEIGAYHDRYREKSGTSVITRKHQYDHALSVRYDHSEHIIIKAEVHYYDGAGKIFDTLARRQLQADLDQHWTMLALKATYLF